jgi:hypothetical protein
MADLSNITALSGLTITSDQTSGTTNPYATFAVSSVTTTQRDLLENVTPYEVNGTTVSIKQGTIIFNITVGNLQMFRDGAWENITTNITTASGTGLSSAPFSIPSGPKASVEVSANETNGFIYYDTTYKEVRGYIDSVWMTLFTINTSATGVGLVNGATLAYPLGQRASVEVSANETNGFIYYDQTHHQLRLYIDDQWMTLFSVAIDISGDGLNNGAPLVCSSGARDDVEVVANQTNGLIYYDTSNNVLRTRVNGAWHTITLT